MRALGRRRPLGEREQRQRGETGASAVEFALVVPILILLVFGVVNFGIVMAQKASLANAVRSGARYATVNAYSAGTHTCQSVIDKVRANAKTVGINDSNKTQVGVTVTFKNASTGSSSTVCAAVAGTATAASGGGSLPCANVNGTPLTPDELVVDASYTSGLLVATPGLGKTVALTNSSAFQCEYYK